MINEKNIIKNNGIIKNNCKYCNKTFYTYSKIKKYCSRACNYINNEKNKKVKKIYCKDCNIIIKFSRRCQDCSRRLYEKSEKNKKEIDKKYMKEKQKDKKWVEENKIKVNKYRKNKYKNDLNFNVTSRLRTLVNLAFNRYTDDGKIRTSKKYGINYEAIINHLKPFPKNTSLYHIDHIRPLCSFEFMDENGNENLKEIKKAFAPENHQWLLAKDNLIKSGKY